ncbi:hypothetical protein AKI39_11180 [Bordetella sp. H567]|uniref:NEL-type E3 ubiquitin ligase domain-containing protein n=1 Tax=Bordetella sp. H567 TaxID=1697043 RepID=UPI00081CE9E9|nr:NEL-type E3 ubiquitin ligase domain-containing protein [Bordetella sp. H567]AOB31143.1 hypothetical protein AKI39_11180 [Bordetella sp. H567]
MARRSCPGRTDAQPLSAQLRTEAFEACIEAAGNCQDGALSIWNKLSMLAIEADVREGRYRGRLADLHSVARSIFRLKELETVASAKVEQLYAQEQQRTEEEREESEIIDPLETHLGYQLGLRQALDLPIPVTRMYYADTAQLTEEDIDQALEVIRQAEKERFPAWLLLDFAPFLSEVQYQLGTTASAEITDAAVEAYEATSRPDKDETRRTGWLPDGALMV